MSSAVDLGGIVESQQRDGEQDLVGKVFTCEDSRHGVGHEQLSERSESSSYSPREAYDSDSEDEDEDCSCQHNTNTRKSVEDTPFENSEHRDRMGTTISQATPFSPITQPSLSRDQQLWNSADKVRTAHCMSSCPVPGADSARNHGSCWYGEDQYVPGDTQWPDSRRAEPPAAVPPPVPALEPQTREVGTQTTPVTRPSLTDASTQWIPPMDVRNTATDTEEHHQPPSGPTPCTPAAPPHFTRGQHKHAHKRQEPLRCWQASSSSPAPSHTHRHTHTHTHNQERNAPWKARGGAHTHTHISVPTPEWRSGPAPAAVHSAAAPVADPVHTWAHQHRQPVRQPCVVDIIQPPTLVLGGGGRTSPLQHAEEVRREQASVLGGEEDRRGGDRRVAPERQEQEWCENLPLSEARARTRAGARDGEEAVVVVVAEQEERGVKSVSEEAETLQEIADILVMMKRRKKNQ